MTPTKLTAEEIKRAGEWLVDNVSLFEIAKARRRMRKIYQHIAAVEQERNDAEAQRDQAEEERANEQAAAEGFEQERDQAREALRAVAIGRLEGDRTRRCRVCFRPDGHTPDCIVGKALPAEPRS